MAESRTMDETAVITLDGSGGGTARLGPLSQREAPWRVISASVKANNNPTDEAVCQIFFGNDTTQSNFRDNTFTGSSGDATDKVAGSLQMNQYVFAVWSGGDPGVQATLTVVVEKSL